MEDWSLMDEDRYLPSSSGDSMRQFYKMLRDSSPNLLEVPWTRDTAMSTRGEQGWLIMLVSMIGADTSSV
jgi:hypothetical protein